MNTKRSLRQHFLATLLTISVSAPIWASGNPDIVGILASITEPANAAELGLSQDQIDKLEALIKEHEGKALDFSSQIRSLPSTERRAKEMENIRIVEKRGMDLLSDQQRTVAEKWRLQKLGPMALLDPETAKQFSVSEEQMAKMQNILEGRRALMRSVGPEKAREEISKRLTETLTEEQKTQWTQLVGAPASPANPTQEGSPSDAVGQPSPPAATPGNALEGRPPAVLSGPSDGLLLNFGGTPWKEVLTFVAREAELSMQTDIYPSGTFTYRDPYRKYTVAEALDIMNGQLLTKGFTLIKKQRTLMVIDLSSAESADVMRSLIRESVELVSPEELDKRGEYELVKCIFTLQRTSVDEIEKAVKSLYGPQGSVVSLPTAGQILVTETGGKLRIIRDTIQRSENPEGPRSAKIVRINLKYVSAEEVLAVARTHLGLKELENKADDISISMDAFGNTIFASGSADKLQKLQDLVRELDTKPDSSSTSAASQEQPVVRTHDVMGSDPETTKAVLESFFAGQPNVNLALDPKTNKIVLRATPSDHDAAVKLIQELAGQSSTFEIVPLGGVDIQVAIQTLERMYGKIPKDKDPATIKGPIYQ
ncbi:MAG: hypothetical protein KGQ60_14980, partial [Planctomycetes bacterium]|nr:hypothetical protein [Planctomycetota bacterium]